MMRFPYYALGLEALNYGAIGFILGHEFGHSLDYSAFLRNEDFSLEKPTVAKVESFVNCTKHRIGIFSHMLNVSVKPDFSINEDISDITGIKTAWYTLNKIRHGSEPRLPGLGNFTNDQLFFLGFANEWCSNGKSSRLNLHKSPHNAIRMRVLNAVSNIPEFTEIWKCPPDSPMNPIKKCILW